MISNTHGNFTFDGPNKIVTCTSGTVEFAAVEVYSRWKDWLAEESDRAKFLPAFTNSLGGETLGTGVFTGSYIFIQNGWKIKPDEADHQLTIIGNLFPKNNGEEIFKETTDKYKVVVAMRTSSLSQQVISSGAAEDLADAVWSKETSSYDDTGTFGNLIKKLLTLSKFIGLK